MKSPPPGPASALWSASLAPRESRFGTAFDGLSKPAMDSCRARGRRYSGSRVKRTIEGMSGRTAAFRQSRSTASAERRENVKASRLERSVLRGARPARRTTSRKPNHDMSTLPCVGVVWRLLRRRGCAVLKDGQGLSHPAPHDSCPMIAESTVSRVASAARLS